MTRKERILARLRELGAEPKRSLGQNFLISDYVVERIVSTVKSQPFQEMVEVGPGLGALTEDLLSLGEPITLIELDRKFAEFWRQRAENAAFQVRVMEGDALRINWKDLALPQGSLFVSNLPYQISSSLVIERSLEPAGLTRMILMFQKEVAQRITARVRTKDYGFLTVIAQTFWETSTVCDAGPNDFFPPPNVASRVLEFRRRDLDWIRSGAGTAQGFLAFAKAGFSQRRKLLIRNLQGFYLGRGKDVLPRLNELFSKQGISGTARAEELDPNAFVRLYLAVVNEEIGNGSGYGG